MSDCSENKGSPLSADTPRAAREGKRHHRQRAGEKAGSGLFDLGWITANILGKSDSVRILARETGKCQWRGAVPIPILGAMTQPHSWTDWFDTTRAAAPHCFMQLATVAADGARCRTLTLRERHGAGLWFTTDQRSEKVTELRRQRRASDGAPRAEACWYDLTSRVQWRFRGPTRFLLPEDHPEDCQRLWERIGDADRARFHGPPPGSVHQGPPPEPAPRIAENFSILVLEAERVDVLELADEPHRHWRYQGVDDTAPTRLMP